MNPIADNTVTGNHMDLDQLRPSSEDSSAVNTATRWEPATCTLPSISHLLRELPWPEIPSQTLDPLTDIPGRVSCAACVAKGLRCSFLTEDDYGRFGYKCADYQSSQSTCTTGTGFLPLPARPLPYSATVPTLMGGDSLARNAGGGYQGVSFSDDHLGGIMGDETSVSTDIVTERHIVGEDVPKQPLRQKRDHCFICRKNRLQCVPSVEGDSESGCLKCQTFGLECWVSARWQNYLRPTAQHLAGVISASSPLVLLYHFCKRCFVEGRCCDRSRPCWQCRQASEECGEVLRVTRASRNTFQYGTAPGEHSALYYMALGYGPWGIGTIRPPNRPDLPGPLELPRFSPLDGDSRSTIARLEFLGPRQEIKDHLTQNGGFVFPPRPTDPNDPGLQQIRGRGYTNRYRTEWVFTWASTPGGPAPPVVVLPDGQLVLVSSLQ